jgi:hypothetical protein
MDAKAVKKVTAVILIVSTAAFLFGCSAAPEDTPSFPPAPDYVISGVNIVARDSERVPAPEVTERVLRLSAEWWGGSISDLRGWTVIFHDDAFPLDPADPSYVVGGVTRAYSRTMEVALKYDLFCPAKSAWPLPHEIGHAIIWDADHLDPRWEQIDELGRLLAGGCPAP